MMKFYECTTCKQLNGVWRLHCQTCGTIPAMYHVVGCDNYNVRPIVPAIGCDRQTEHLANRVYLRTVELDYYAGA